MAQSVDGFSGAVAPDSFVLGPPNGSGPVAIEASIELHDIDLINDEDQVFEFTGTTVLKWRDPRQAFDPVKAGVDEKVFQGDYQFNELSPSWFPQVVLVNEAEPLETSGVALRVRSDGTSTLTMKLNAAAKVDLDLRRFPFDRHRVEMIFEVLGFDASEVVMQVAEDHATLPAEHIRVPQWSVEGATLSTRERQVSSAGPGGVASSLVLAVDVDRDSDRRGVPDGDERQSSAHCVRHADARVPDTQLPDSVCNGGDQSGGRRTRQERTAVIGRPARSPASGLTWILSRASNEQP
jgi:hypothetical protein